MPVHRAIAAATNAAALSLFLLAGAAVAKGKAADTTVVCKDGTTDKGGRGACRGHKGVDKAATAAKESGAAAKEPEGKAAPADSKAAEAGETVTCSDGTTGKKGRGACRGHGGVDKKAGKKTGAAPAANPAEAARNEPSKPAEADSPAPARAKARKGESDKEQGPATAKCKDGTLSHSKHRTGTCSRHGGVAEWLNAG